MPVSHNLLDSAAAHHGTRSHFLPEKIGFPLFAALVDVVTASIRILWLRLVEWVVLLLFLREKLVQLAFALEGLLDTSAVDLHT